MTAEIPAVNWHTKDKTYRPAYILPLNLSRPSRQSLFHLTFYICLPFQLSRHSLTMIDGFTLLNLNDCLCSLIHILVVFLLIFRTTSVSIWGSNRYYWITYRKIWARNCASYPTTNHTDLWSQDNLLSHSKLWFVSLINSLKLEQTYLSILFI